MQITRGTLVTPDKENPDFLRALKRVKHSLRHRKSRSFRHVPYFRDTPVEC